MIPKPKRLVERCTQRYPTRNHDLEITDPGKISTGIWAAFRFRGETEGLTAPVFRALAPRDELPDVLSNASSWPVYSQRLADVFAEHAVCARVLITFGKQREASAFCLCAPKATIDGLDETLTLWGTNRFQPNKKVVEKAVLRQDLHWPPFFRLKGLENLTFVNEETAAKIEALGLTGLGFEEDPNRP